jgi:hypothetical protein
MELRTSMRSKVNCALTSVCSIGGHVKTVVRDRLRPGTAKRVLPLVLVYIVAGFTFANFGTAAAGDFDGSKLLICATVDALDCVSGENCTKGRAADMGAPTFLRVDFANKTIGGQKRTTQIVSMDTSADQILLQGKELGFGWTFALDQEGGNFSATLVNRDGVFVLFGSCMPL